MAHAATLNRLGSALAPLSNWAGATAGRRLARRAAVGHRSRAARCRASSAITFANGFAGTRPRSTPATAAPRGPIVLLDDCLTSYCEPSVNRAAVEVLEAAGYEVHLAGLDCCGRTLVSKGFLTEAQELARANIERLLPWAERGVPIVGCEPSCLLMLVDEYPDLVPGDAARTVAAAGRAGRFAPGASRHRAAAARRSRQKIAAARPLPSKGAGRRAGHAWRRWQRCRRPTCSWSIPAAAAWPARSATSTTT